MSSTGAKGGASIRGTDELFRLASWLEKVGDAVLEANPRGASPDEVEPRRVGQRDENDCYVCEYPIRTARLGPLTTEQVVGRSHLPPFSEEEVRQLRGCRVVSFGDGSIRIESANEEGTVVVGRWEFDSQKGMYRKVNFQAQHRWFGDPSRRPRSRVRAMVTVGGEGEVIVDVGGAKFGYFSDVSRRPFIRGVAVEPWTATGRARLIVNQAARVRGQVSGRALGRAR